MDWAAKRRFVILSIIGGVAVVFLATVLIATLYEAPTCTDNKRNQGEDGLDCGGLCPYACTADKLSPTVLFSRPLQSSGGRTDVIAEVENKNPDVAAKGVAYTVVLYDATQTFVQSVNGVLDLPPSTIVPVFVPGISSGKQNVASAFLTIDPDSIKWYQPSGNQVVPKVGTPVPSGTPSAPRVEATLTNPSATALTDIRAVVLVRNEKADVIAASATIIPSIPAFGQAIAIFSWNEPFLGVPTTFEVIPIRVLP